MSDTESLAGSIRSQHGVSDASSKEELEELAEEEVEAENVVALERAKPSKDAEADRLSRETSKAEFENKTMLGLVL